MTEPMEAKRCATCGGSGYIVDPPTQYDLDRGESRRLHRACPDCQPDPPPAPVDEGPSIVGDGFDDDDLLDEAAPVDEGERWTIYVCGECGSPALNESVRCPGKQWHGGDRYQRKPVKVVPASSLDQALRERDEAAWNVREFACDGCRRAVSYESKLPGLRCALCPYCGTGALRSARARAEAQRDRYREALERIVNVMGEWEFSSKLTRPTYEKHCDRVYEVGDLARSALSNPTPPASSEEAE